MTADDESYQTDGGHPSWGNSPVKVADQKDAYIDGRIETLKRLEHEIAVRENEMNRKGGLEDNVTTASGYFAAAGALNWVRVVLIGAELDTILQPGTPSGSTEGGQR